MKDLTRVGEITAELRLAKRLEARRHSDRFSQVDLLVGAAEAEPDMG